MMVRMHVDIQDLMIIDHAIRQYVGREDASRTDIMNERNLLDRINDNIKVLRRLKYGEKAR